MKVLCVLTHLLLYQVVDYSLTEKHLNKKHLHIMEKLRSLFLEINMLGLHFHNYLIFIE